MYTVYNPLAMIAYRYPDHEQSVGQITREMGFNHVSLSSLVMPMVRIVPRGFTGTCTGIYTIYLKCMYTIITSAVFLNNCNDLILTFYSMC